MKFLPHMLQRVMAPVSALLLASASLTAFAQTPEKVTVRLDWLAGAYHAPLFVAKEKGYFAEQGLDVRISNGQGSISTLQVVGAGNDTIGLANLSALAMAASRGVPVVAIGGLIQKAPEAVISLKSSGIKTPKDLEGKRWGAVAGDEAQRLFPAFAAKNGIDIKKIRKVTLNHSAAITSLLNGDVDFICAWALQDGLKISKVKPISEPMLFSDAGLNTMGTSFFVTRKTLADRPDVLRRFMLATQKGAAEVERNPKLAVEAVMRARPEGSRAVLAEEIVQLPGYRYTANSKGRPFGWLSPVDIEGMLAIQREYHSLPRSITPASIYTDRFAGL